MAALPRRLRLLVLLCTLGLGLLLFVWRLGSTGLVDETPPLFAASARGMVERGDWLIPHVNGLPRYDKPPLVYWLMALLYSLPGQAHWDPLGTWASSLPSALGTIAVMLVLADTLLRWPQPPQLLQARPRRRPGAEAPAAVAASELAMSPAGGAPEPGGRGFGAASWPVEGPPELGKASAAPAERDRSLAASLEGGEEPTGLAVPPWPAALTALTAALAFALSPLVLLWGRIPVSDALFTAMVSLTFLAVWRRLADPAQPWALPWLLLGLAVLTKGPVAVVLLAFTLGLFTLLQGDKGVLRYGRDLAARLRPLPGLALTALVSLPWYGLALWRDGSAFWDSFIGYHNLQRFTAVVNRHLEPWWYFGPVLLLAAVPLTPLLLLGLARAIGPLRLRRRRGLPLPVAALSLAPSLSLARFAACWLLAILLFFTLAATKLPSYWLPATPAAALLVALAAQLPWGPTGRGAGSDGLTPGRGQDAVGADRPADSGAPRPDRALRLAWGLSLLLAAVLTLAFALAPLWVPLIFDPEMPSLPADLLASGFLVRAAWCWGLAALLGWLLRARVAPLRLLALQLPVVLFAAIALLPSWALGDGLRGLPVRQMAAAATRQASPGEPLAMVGILKPSLHYYSRRVVIYEGIEPEGLVNLSDRLRHERRPGMHPAPQHQVPTVLVVIDRTTASYPFWQGLAPQELSRFGLYRLWRLDRARLEARAAALQAAGHPVTWTRPRPERY